MAHFFAALESDPVRREALLAEVVRRLGDLERMEVAQVRHGNAVAAWAVAPHAPRDVSSAPDGTGILLGEAMARGDARRLSARDLMEEWPVDGSAPPSPRDGFFAFLRLEAGGIAVQQDLLGIFPVHHAVAGGTAMVSTSPWLLRAHPAVRAELDPEGVAGLLLANGIVAGRTILRGVTRLEPGAVLSWRPAAGQWQERPVYRPPVSATHHLLPVAEMAHRLHDAVDAAVARHLAGQGEGVLLLSGGLDSRILAGIISRQRLPFTAVTYGIPSDQEAQIAARVAAACGLPHRLERRGTARGLQAALQWEGLSAVPGSGGAGDRLAVPASRIATGYLMDAIVGGSDVLWSYDPVQQCSGFEVFLAQLNRWGFRPDALGRLLRPEVFGDAVPTVVDRLRKEYASGGDNDLERSYRMDLRHIQRHHVGRVLWRQTRSAWPSSPSIDQVVLETAGGMPLPLLAERRLENEILLRQFPELASLPLDRNSYDTRALDPRLRDLVVEAGRHTLRKLRRRFPLNLLPELERRYYHRSFDFNSPVWREERAAADLVREAAYALFVPEEFDRLVPRAEVVWQGEAIKEASGLKALVAITLLQAQLASPGPGPG